MCGCLPERQTERERERMRVCNSYNYYRKVAAAVPPTKLLTDDDPEVSFGFGNKASLPGGL